MSSKVSKSQFKAKALEYFRLVEKSGETIVVTDHGRPVLEVRPYRNTEKEPFELLKGSLLRYGAPTEPVGDEWDAA
jgi:antitoxin (DNA-binding transcriptional repressor) of toxin-antitoxin stability system